ncbi:trihelix transcription factor GTL1 [Ricinus communis]|uniref:trihelix transcription factor GTL1 n=1 Tax=Ricinus communis TaxID=3988 RepID=UPI00201A4541|nr:trihelix transcription factor GTL1 [Ricinus communis]
MELLTGGNRQGPNASGFPPQISPLSATENYLVSYSTSAFQPSPPQKLRPIRANGRSPSSSQGNDLTLTGGGGLDGTLDNLGLLVDQVCGLDDEGNEFLKPLVKVENSGTQCTESGGSGRVGRNLDPNCEGELLEVESSSFSGDDDSSAGITKCGSRKRRRNTSLHKLEKFLESLVMKVLDKQERMHTQLIETMERRERERIIREEAWKQQEIERMKRDEEVRAQENARNLALISFIQDVMGHNIEVPQPLTSIALPEKVTERNGSNVPIQKDFNSDLSNRRWPEAEVQALIMLRAGLEQKFRVMGAKCSNVWDEISVGMCNMGYNRTAKNCKEKWENINKYFRKSMGSGGKKRYDNSKSCPYFHELDILYKNGFVSPGNVSDHTNIENETKIS